MIRLRAAADTTAKSADGHLRIGFITNMSERDVPAHGGAAAGRLNYYGAKFDQHLSRVQLSHRLASARLALDSNGLDSISQGLLAASFADSLPHSRQLAKLQRGLNEIHLVALKGEFELFLNRVLTTLSRAHYSLLASKARIKGDVSLSELAEAAVDEASSRELVLQFLIPSHGLVFLVAALATATGIRLPKDLRTFDYSHWCQIEVAFQVRNLIEHRDCKIDAAFRDYVERFWDKSTWGRRAALPDLDERVAVEEDDIRGTYASMRETGDAITRALMQWDAQPRVKERRAAGR